MGLPPVLDGALQVRLSSVLPLRPFGFTLRLVGAPGTVRSSVVAWATFDQAPMRAPLSAATR